MAATKYIVLSRYYNPTTNMCVTNGTEIKWTAYNENEPEIEKFAKEVMMIDNEGSGSGTTSSEMQKIIIENIQKTNPKYDMIFGFKGVDVFNEDVPFAVCDRFFRIKGDPWFTNSYVGSLQAAMENVKRLSNSIGKENVILGKIVPLDQYIEIV